jgi:alkanesulfonate monooxygenase SsuD/methylene tetrahydromethanopterin reductase-like flavin-dependent oxidoreductase (luciferase family)
MQFGAYTFVETRRDPRTGEPVDVDKSFADVIEQIELADRVGLDVFGLGEHHRPDYAVSAPAVALAAAAARTKGIRLTSASRCCRRTIRCASISSRRLIH